MIELRDITVKGSATREHLLANVLHWVKILEGTEGPDGYDGDVFEFFCDSFLDIEYRVGGGVYRGAEITVVVGGPTVWIDTRRNQVVGTWGHDRISRGYDDNVGLDDWMDDTWAASNA